MSIPAELRAGLEGACAWEARLTIALPEDLPRDGTDEESVGAWLRRVGGEHALMAAIERSVRRAQALTEAVGPNGPARATCLRHRRRARWMACNLHLREA